MSAVSGGGPRPAPSVGKELGISLRWYKVWTPALGPPIDLELAGQRHLVRTELDAGAAGVFQGAGVRPPSQVTPL